MHGEQELSKHNVVLGVCGPDEDFQIIENDEIVSLLNEAFPPENDNVVEMEDATN